MYEKLRDQYRYFLKDSIRKVINFSETDQQQGVSKPPIEKPYHPEAPKIPLTKPGEWTDTKEIDLEAAIGQRESRRQYKRAPLSLEELSFLLWATQGVREQNLSGHALRTVPSAGCRHTFETYLAVNG